jgi:tRNA(fMet)-specific endonuclease VapC
MKYMLDTNMCIYIIKKKPARVLEKFTSLKTDDVCISAITLAELQYGVYKSMFPERNELALLNFLVPITLLSFSDGASIFYGKIRRDLEKRGQVIGANDLLIAAHALSENLILVTNNTKEFCRIPNLALENWVE